MLSYPVCDTSLWQLWKANILYFLFLSITFFVLLLWLPPSSDFCFHLLNSCGVLFSGLATKCFPHLHCIFPTATRIIFQKSRSNYSMPSLFKVFQSLPTYNTHSLHSRSPVVGSDLPAHCCDHPLLYYPGPGGLIANAHNYYSLNLNSAQMMVPHEPSACEFQFSSSLFSHLYIH